ncbi:MAG: ABC transporter permease [Bacteroidota bacterium]|nr:ABC transporter permease [Bacteroidota bacterium]
MIRNYFTTAIRNLLKHKFISGINLFGLTIGFSCCLLITAYVLQELSYDRYNKNAGDIYRITRTFNNQQGVVSLTLATVSPPFGYYLPSEFPEIKNMTRLVDMGQAPLRYQEKMLNEDHLWFGDEHFFEVFTANLQKGDPKTALANPYSVVMTRETARKYFGEEDPINKIIRLNNQLNLKVTGIYEALPSNAHMHPGLLVSFNTLRDSAIYGEKQLQTNWGNNSFFTYLQLPPGVDPKKIEARFPAFLDKHMADQYGGGKPSDFTKLSLQKLTDIHLYSHTDYEAEANSDIRRVYIFSAVAFFILLIACINYMNLATARASLRAREIGVRKVIGAGKKELILQFLGESVLISMLAVLLAIGIFVLAVPLLNELTGQQISRSIVLQWPVMTTLIVAPVIVGVLSGIYPALFMSGFQPIKTLKGLIKTGKGGLTLRKALVVGQFTISIILIITTAVVYRQLKYMQEKSLGFNREHVAYMTYPNSLGPQFESFKHELLSNAACLSAGRSSRIPSDRLLDDMGAATLSGDSMKPSNTDIKYVAADEGFLETYGLRMVAGRNFSKEFGTDSSGFIINATAAKALGWTETNAVGKAFKYGLVRGRIIGVVNDFNFESLHQSIVPMVFLLSPSNGNQYNVVSVRVNGNQVNNALQHIEAVWKKYLPEQPFQSAFVDDKFSKLYHTEQLQGSLFTIFADIAIFIACLGLLGLSAFSINQRVKEIGIRKVLGASTGSIVQLLSKEFLMLVLIAAVFAIPVAWWAMHQWLQDFAYRSGIPWWILVLAALIATIVALGTISVQAIKAALANPVKSLRSE